MLIKLWIIYLRTNPNKVYNNSETVILTFIKIRMCLRDFLLEKFKDSFKNALISSIFELQKCYLYQNGIEFDQEMNGNVFVRLVRHPRE